MRASELTERLKVWRPAARNAGFGDAGPVFEPYRDGTPIPAQKLRQSGGMRQEAGESFPAVHADFYVWFQDCIETGWRIEDIDQGILYEVTATDFSRKGNWRLIRCERVNL